MKTIIFPKSSEAWYGRYPLFMDTNTLDVKTLGTTGSGIDTIAIAPEDCEVRYYEDGKPVVLRANKGDIIISFVKRAEYKYKVIVVKNREWKENIARREAAERAEEIKTVVTGAYKYNEMRKTPGDETMPGDFSED